MRTIGDRAGLYRESEQRFKFKLDSTIGLIAGPAARELRSLSTTRSPPRHG